MEHIKNTIEELISSLQKQRENFTIEKLEEIFSKTFTEKELPHIKYAYFSKGILGIRVDSSNWMYHFNIQKKRLLTRLEQDVKDIKDIKFYIGDFQKSK